MLGEHRLQSRKRTLDDGEIGVVGRGAHEQDAHRPLARRRWRRRGPQALVETILHDAHIVAQFRQRRGERRGRYPDRIGAAYQPRHQPCPWPQQLRIGMIARYVPQIIVEVVQQCDAVLAAVADQCIGGVEVSHRIALRDDDVGAVVQRLVRFGQHDVEVAADRRMIERLQQPDIRAWGERAAGEAFRYHHHADPVVAAQIDRSVAGRGRRAGAGNARDNSPPPACAVSRPAIYAAARARRAPWRIRPAIPRSRLPDRPARSSPAPPAVPETRRSGWRRSAGPHRSRRSA